jgi:hypothetical protein
LRTTRQCFYAALATGFACFAPQLGFFWRISGAAYDRMRQMSG